MGRRGSRAATLTGIRTTPHGFQAYIRVKGELHTKRFTRDTDPLTMDLWRQKTRLRYLGALPELVIADGATFAEDAKRYLLSVEAMPSYADRQLHIKYWIGVFGHLPRTQITSVQIRTQLAALRRKYSASTVNHYRTALMHLWTVLDGRSSPNPVKDVPRFREDSQERPPHALSPLALRALFGAMQPSASKARLQLIAWTGWPHAQIRQLEKSDIDWPQRLVFVRGRQKGRGVKGRWLPLTPRGWAALRIFRRWKAWGWFSPSALRQFMRRAAERIVEDEDQPAPIRKALEDVTPYDLRHSFLTLIALTTRDDRVVAALGMHADRRQSDRYTRAATDPRVATALSEVANALKQAKKA